MLGRIRILAINGPQMTKAQKEKESEIPTIQIDCVEKLNDGRIAIDFSKREFAKAVYLVDGDGNRIARFTVDLDSPRQVIHSTQGYLEVYDSKYVEVEE